MHGIQGFKIYDEILHIVDLQTFLATLWNKELFTLITHSQGLIHPIVKKHSHIKYVTSDLHMINKFHMLIATWYVIHE